MYSHHLPIISASNIIFSQLPSSGKAITNPHLNYDSSCLSSDDDLSKEECLVFTVTDHLKKSAKNLSQVTRQSARARACAVTNNQSPLPRDVNKYSKSYHLHITLNTNYTTFS